MWNTYTATINIHTRMNLQPINIADSLTNTHTRATLQPINIADSYSYSHEGDSSTH